MKSRVAGYLRVSTAKQKEIRIPIATQKERITTHCIMLELVKSENEIMWYIDDGYSGSSLERPDMKRLIGDIKLNKIDIVFSNDFSRISRDLFDSNLFISLTKKYGVVYKSLYSEVETENDSASDRYKNNITFINNQYERDRTIERTNDGLTHIANSGRYPCGGKILFGYIRGDDKDIYKHKTNSQIVEEAFRLACSGIEIQKIKQYINTAQSEKYFDIQQLKKMFRDERYAGILVYKGKKYKNIIPAIVSLETLKKAAGTCINIYNKKNKNFVFEKLVECSCGNTMSCSSADGRNKRYFYYKCNECKTSISQLDIEKKLSISFIGSENKKESLKKLDKERYALKRRIDREREKFLDKRLRDREFASIIIPLEDRLDELNFIRKGLTLKSQLSSYRELEGYDEKKAYAQTNIKKIIIDSVNRKVLNIEYKDNQGI